MKSLWPPVLLLSSSVTIKEARTTQVSFLILSEEEDERIHVFRLCCDDRTSVKKAKRPVWIFLTFGPGVVDWRLLVFSTVQQCIKLRLKNTVKMHAFNIYRVCLSCISDLFMINLLVQ